jgi:tripartite-type tricarboxylate transporter receptor subunit TctC
MFKTYFPALAAFGFLWGSIGMQPGYAQAPAEFYAGRTIDLYIGFSPGGAYDIYARQLAHFMSNHLAGHPTLVPKTMTGAGGLTLANFLYNVAPKDGTAFGTFSRGMVTEPLLGKGARFDAAKFLWLGSIASETSLCASWEKSPVATWDDMLHKNFVVGGTGSGADTDVFAPMLKNMFGAKLKLITGYPGGNEVNLAMQRGEIDGRCGWTWSAIKTTSMKWVTEKKIRLLIQLGMSKNPDLPDVPWVMDLATNDHDRQVLKLLMARLVVAWPFVAPPGLPEERKAELRKAFDETVRDPGFLAETRRRGLNVSPVSGPEIDALIAELYGMPSALVGDARAAAGLAR